MEIQLQQLIDQIKNDGVKAAEEKTASLLSSAQAEAEKIIADAQAEADRILSRAKEENARMTQVSEDAIRQAGRNLLLSFRESVNRELDAIVGAQVSAAYSPEALSALISKTVENWAKERDAEDITVLLTPADLAAMEDALRAALKAKMLEGVTLKASDTFGGGFRIASRKDGVFYDYSTEAVTEMLSAYLNPRLSALMKEAEGV